MKKMICTGMFSWAMFNAMCQSKLIVPDTNHLNKLAPSFGFPLFMPKSPAPPLFKNTLPGLLSQAKPSADWILPQNNTGKIIDAKLDNMPVVLLPVNAVEEMPNAYGLVITGDWVVPTKKRP